MVKQLSAYLLIAGAVCAAAASDSPPVAAANATIVESMRAESSDATPGEMQIASLGETFPSVESAMAAAATAQAGMRFEH